jgi:hypothetical protein
MKQVTGIAILLSVSALLSSCTKNEYYTTTPSTKQPVGYQNIFDDNFDYDAHNWSFSDPGNRAYVDIAQGTLKYSYLPSGDGTNTVAVNTGLNPNRDFLIQTKMQSNYQMALVFGVSNSEYGYSFFIDDKGYFAVYSEGNANIPVKTILDWQYNAAIVSGWNSVEIEQHNGYWTGYVNGKKLFEIAAQSLYGTKVGYEVMAGTTGYADYLTVQW